MKDLAHSDEALLGECRSAVELLAGAGDALAAVGGAAEVAARVVSLREELARDELVIEIRGPRCAEAVEVLTGEALLPPRRAMRGTVRLRAGAALGFVARFPDGLTERPPDPEENDLIAQLAEAERVVAERAEEERRLSEVSQQAERVAGRAREQLALVEHDLKALDPTPLPAPAPPPMPGTTPTAVTVPARRPKRTIWAVLLGWLAALVRRLFGRPRAAAPPPPIPPPALPPTPPPPPPAPPEEPVDPTPTVEETLASGSPRGIAAVEARIAEEAKRAATIEEGGARAFERFLDAKQRLAAAVEACERARRAITEQREARRQRIVGRIRALLAAREEAPAAVEIESPGVPPGVVLLVARRAATARHLVDGMLSFGALQAGHQEPDDRPTRHLDEPTAVAPMLVCLDELRVERNVARAQLALSALRACRQQVTLIAERSRHAYDRRVQELSAIRLNSDARRAREQAAAEQAVQRHAGQIMQQSTAHLEKLIEEVRSSWEARIASCAGLEQLRAEVAAIENGAAVRLSLVCDEVREDITVRSARLVLEMSRPLRQELLQMRLKIARGRSPGVEETFEDVRVALPAWIDARFGALRTPEVGALLEEKRGLFGPLFQTLARERKHTTAIVRTRLAEIAKTTAHELSAAAEQMQPMLLGTLGSLTSDLLGAHERWIEARLLEEQRTYEAERERHAPARELAERLAQKEAAIAERL